MAISRHRSSCCLFGGGNALNKALCSSLSLLLPLLLLLLLSTTTLFAQAQETTVTLAVGDDEGTPILTVSSVDGDGTATLEGNILTLSLDAMSYTFVSADGLDLLAVSDALNTSTLLNDAVASGQNTTELTIATTEQLSFFLRAATSVNPVLSVRFETSDLVCNYGEWSACALSNGACVRTREAEDFSEGCTDPLVETEACNAADCECTVSAWSEWTDCSVTCGFGSRTRTRNVLANPSNDCPPVVDTDMCPGNPVCPSPTIELEDGEFNFITTQDHDFKFTFGDGTTLELRSEFDDVRSALQQEIANLEDGRIADAELSIDTLADTADDIASDVDTLTLSVMANTRAISSTNEDLEHNIANVTSETSINIAALSTHVDMRLGVIGDIASDLANLSDSHADHNESLTDIFVQLGLFESQIGDIDDGVATATSNINEAGACADEGKLYSVSTGECVDSNQLPTTQSACNAEEHAGRLFYSIANETVFVCNGEEWVPIYQPPVGTSAAVPATSCAHIYRVGSAQQDGLYWIRSGDQVGRQHCLLSRDGFSLGGDGSEAAPGLSCGTIQRIFQKNPSDAGMYYVNPGLNDPGSALDEKVVHNCVFAEEVGGDGRSGERPATSCYSMLMFYPENAPYDDGAYWIKIASHSPARVFCEMHTEGGGWALTSKLLGNNAALNSRNTANWRDGTLLGDTTTMREENAVGPAYLGASFRDVMILSLNPNNRHQRLGWRHPRTFTSVHSIVTACQPVDDGVKMFGGVHLLDYPNSPYNRDYVECTASRYGFLIQDWDEYKRFNPFGCPALQTGHAIGIAGTAIPSAPYSRYNDQSDDVVSRCVSNFAYGGGYYQVDGGNTLHSLNAHWWGAGNARTWNWNAHGLLVRDSTSPTAGGDGSSPAAAGLSCQSIKQTFEVTSSGMFYIFADETPGVDQIVPVFCDMSTNPATNLGSDGSTEKRFSTSCWAIKTFFPHLAEESKAYYIYDKNAKMAKPTFCDMKSGEGGWTLLAKIRQNDGTLNLRNNRQWQWYVHLDWLETMSNTNALGSPYTDVSFTDVMVRSVARPRRSLAWRHKRTYPSLHYSVENCVKDVDTIHLWGQTHTLDIPGSNSDQFNYYHACSPFFYGIHANDQRERRFDPQGCTNLYHRHSMGLVGGAIQDTGTRNYGSDDGRTTRCLTNFGVGGGYDTVSSGDDTHAINAHWWGDGNTHTNNWNSHAIFVRNTPFVAEISSFWGFGDGSSAAKAGLSCEHLRVDFDKTTSGIYWIKKHRGSEAVRVRCELVSGKMQDLGGDGSSLIAAGRDCLTINRYFGVTSSGTYWLQDRTSDGELAYRAYCDQETGDGGWTLVAKVRGNDATMNIRQWHIWRDATLLGSTEDMHDTNSLGKGYTSVPFRDIMVRALGDASKNIAWRHDKERSSLGDTVQACETVSDGQVLFGGIRNLDSPWISNSNYNPCSALKYGILIPDHTQSYFGPAGCGHINNGHGVSIVGAGIQAGTGGSTNGVNSLCISNWGVGSGYTTVDSGDDTYAINAHWWGNGNTGTWNWASHAIFVRGE